MTQDTQEQGADQALLSIQAEASAMEDKYRPVDPNAPTEPEASDVAMLEKANVEIVEFVWDAAGGFLPEDVASRYGKDQRERIAKSWTALAIKRGWDIGMWMAEWGPEIAFGAALMGPALPLLVARWKASKAKGVPSVGHQ